MDVVSALNISPVQSRGVAAVAEQKMKKAKAERVRRERR